MRTYTILALIPLAITGRAAAEGNIDGADRFAAPNGQLGAGLSFADEQKGRAYAELAFARAAASTSVAGASADTHINSLSLMLGGAYKVRPDIELEAMLPIAWAQYATSVTFLGQTASTSRAGLAVANLHLGASYLRAERPWRLKVGGALEYGPWTHNYEAPATVAVASMHPAYGGENFGLFAPDEFSIVTPARFEYGEQLVGSGDVQLGLHFPTHGGSADFTIQLGPGIGYYVTPAILLGLRLPFTWVPTESGSSATFFAAEPYARFDFGKAFVNTSLMLNIDDPYGFAFDSGKWWSIHVGGGGTF
jgi:hypothetical protein